MLVSDSDRQKELISLLEGLQGSRLRTAFDQASESYPGFKVPDGYPPKSVDAWFSACFVWPFLLDFLKDFSRNLFAETGSLSHLCYYQHLVLVNLRLLDKSSLEEKLDRNAILARVNDIKLQLVFPIIEDSRFSKQSLSLEKFFAEAMINDFPLALRLLSSRKVLDLRSGNRDQNAICLALRNKYLPPAEKEGEKSEVHESYEVYSQSFYPQVMDAIERRASFPFTTKALAKFKEGIKTATSEEAYRQVDRFLLELSGNSDIGGHLPRCIVLEVLTEAYFDGKTLLALASEIHGESSSVAKLLQSTIIQEKLRNLTAVELRTAFDEAATDFKRAHPPKGLFGKIPAVPKFPANKDSAQERLLSILGDCFPGVGIKSYRYFVLNHLLGITVSEDQEAEKLVRRIGWHLTRLWSYCGAMASDRFHRAISEENIELIEDFMALNRHISDWLNYRNQAKNETTFLAQIFRSSKSAFYAVLNHPKYKPTYRITYAIMGAVLEDDVDAVNALLQKAEAAEFATDPDFLKRVLCGERRDQILHVAASRGNPMIVALLLEFGADSTQENAKGQVPEDVACNRETRACFDLLKYGPKLFCSDSDTLGEDWGEEMQDVSDDVSVDVSDAASDELTLPERDLELPSPSKGM